MQLHKTITQKRKRKRDNQKNQSSELGPNEPHKLQKRHSTKEFEFVQQNQNQAHVLSSNHHLQKDYIGVIFLRRSLDQLNSTQFNSNFIKEPRRF
jgi:hypothetical protein